MRRALLIAVCGVAVLAAAPALAQPAAAARVDRTIADVGSAYYGFERLSVTSEDGARVYRVWIATPKRPAPPGGYPVAWLLDGDAALTRIDEGLLARLDAATRPSSSPSAMRGTASSTSWRAPSTIRPRSRTARRSIRRGGRAAGPTPF